jgi:hypothetical protein
MSCGPDGIPSLALKKLAVQLSVPFQYIFERSLKEGEIPALWKMANVVPLFKKKGRKNDPKNYRPISLTSNVCKAMEKIIKRQMLEFLSATNELSEYQCGFMERRSTVSQLLQCLNDWTESVDKGVPIDVIYLDVAKAFDSVSHEKLLSSLDHCGIRNEWLNWIRSFLTARTQTVNIDQCHSNEARVTSGVPQGSVLGPILFLIYINSLVRALKHSSIRLYADDAKIYFRVGSEADFQALTNDLEAINEWMTNAQLNLAVTKCEALHVGFSNKRRDIIMNGEQIPSTHLVRDLGFYVSDDLKFSRHVDNIVATAYRRLNAIFRCFTTRSIGFLCRMYCVYIRPILEYGTPVWNPYLIKDILKIEGVQRNFTRRIPGFSQLDYKLRLERLKLETLELRRLKFDLLEVFKILNGLIDINCSEFFELRRDCVTRGHALKIVLPKYRLDVRRHSFSIRVIKPWNALPDFLANCASVSVFRKELDKLDLSTFLSGCFS